VIDAIESRFTRIGLTVDQRELLARVGPRAVGVAAIAVFGSHREKPALAEVQPGKATDVVELAIALVEFAVAVVQTGAAVGPLEHDVDHAGNGIRTVLRRRAVAQYFDALDGAARDGIEIDRRGAAAQTAVDVDDGGGVPALAVDQHQRLIGRQTAQLRRAHVVRSVGDRGVGEVERRNGTRQRLDQLAGAMRIELLDAEHIDRRQRLGDRAIGQTGTGDDHLIQAFGFGFICNFGVRGGGILRCDGTRRQHQSNGHQQRAAPQHRQVMRLVVFHRNFLYEVIRTGDCQTRSGARRVDRREVRGQ